MTKTNTKAGFSLVELMVVVAIIGILATIAVPNFTKFQSKAKQSSAKADLTGLYTAQKAFFAEYNTYHTNLLLTGFVPEGVTVAATGAACVAGVPNNVRLYATGFGIDGGGIAAAATLPAGAAAPCTAATYALTGFYNWSANSGSAGVITNTLDASVNDFDAEAVGKISGSGTEDRWTIDENKSLTNSVSGL
jgi:type IV pilus assembly protein PilA